jgi:DNA-directed RNA polymerase subunit L
MNAGHDGGSFLMPVKVLTHDKNELRVRFIGESHTSLQILRVRLNEDKGVDYANFFPGHPDLDEPEMFIRTNKGVDPAKLLKGLVAEISGDFGALNL